WVLGHMARRLSLRRSRSDRPPQIPKRSSCSRAYSRHSARTSQEVHTRLASRVEPPFSVKNASGSVCAHKARSCHDRAPSSSPKKSVRPMLPSGRGVGSGTPEVRGPSPRMFHTGFPQSSIFFELRRSLPAPKLHACHPPKVKPKDDTGGHSPACICWCGAHQYCPDPCSAEYLGRGSSRSSADVVRTGFRTCGAYRNCLDQLGHQGHK